MKRTKRMSLGVAAVTAATAALLGAAVLPGAQATRPSRPAAAATAPANSGIPAFVDPGADLAGRTPGPGREFDSIYVDNWVKGGGHRYGIVVHVINPLNPAGGQPQLRVSVSDETTGWYKNYVAVIPRDKFTWSTERLYISTPGLTWAGDEQDMSIDATTPWGAIGLRLADKGPALNYAGNGVDQVWGGLTYQYALPYLSATGTLTVRGQASNIAGGSWLDRQWGSLPFTASARWTWMDLNLSNGDKVAVWDARNSTTENSWATVLHPDGSYELAVVRPLADGASRPWTSPASGNTYPTRWSVDIPSLKSRFQVGITGADDQELTSAQLPPGPAGVAVEATGAVTGRFEGGRVTGHTYIEEVGAWQA